MFDSLVSSLRNRMEEKDGTTGGFTTSSVILTGIFRLVLPAFLALCAAAGCGWLLHTFIPVMADDMVNVIGGMTGISFLVFFIGFFSFVFSDREDRDADNYGLSKIVFCMMLVFTMMVFAGVCVRDALF